MNDQDPLSQLFKDWQPQSPHQGDRFVQDTLRRIRKVRQESLWKRALIACTEFSETWLPSPGIGVSVAASVILLLAGFYWSDAIQQGKSLAALQWHEQLSNPLSKESLAGTYAQFTQKD